MNKGAWFSGCGKFRYLLIRQWDSKPYLVFCMLNPSTADGVRDDPTIRKCIGFAQRSGYGGIKIVNLYAFKATKPKDLFNAGLPEGEENQAHIYSVSLGQDVVLAWGSWGAHCRIKEHAGHVERRITESAARVIVLHRNSDGTPAHPLMLPYSCINPK